ncbi:MAG: xanthine dehydrogenase family protein molybdopterin-binding subunit [Deltaproteobacteria bacterium]|nr:xanthine dehydrogenase family protein molybdopterin-binding subunit [Deltaproteobacteria bacterium]
MKTRKNSKTADNNQGISFSLSRREFLKAVGGGIIIFFTAGELPAQEGSRRFPGWQSLPTDFNAFLRIGANGRVSCFTGKIEMGQGIATSLAQMLADELDVSVEQVDMVMGDTDQCPWDMGTWGSLSTRVFGPPLRQAGAEARSVLLELAAEHLKVPADQLVIKEGTVTSRQDKTKHITYARLCEGKYIRRHSQTKPSPKQPGEFKLMGKSLNRLDSRDKVTGEAKFTGDIRLPGMLYAKILRPPAHGAALKKIDSSALKNNKEILGVQDNNLVAVLHSLPDVAENALSLIKAEFEGPPNPIDNSTIFSHLLQTAPKKGEVFGQKGNLEQGQALASQIFEHTYYDHYVAHSAMETHTALARMEGDKLTLWASTQNPFGIKEEVALALNLPPQKVRVITPFVGGGFGGKTFNQQAVEAAQLAQKTGKPVQVMWSRKEEFFYDTFRPAAIVRIRSGLTETGRIAFWEYDTYYAGRGVQQIYNVAHYRETAYGGWMTPAAGGQLFRTGAWRAPGNPTNTFARESQIDIMAAKIGADPLEFRIQNINDKRMLATLQAAADRFGWKKVVSPSRQGQGLACSTDAGTYVATMAEVEVDRTSGKVRVKRLICAQDMGLVINPEGARIQMEGCLTMGLGYALSEKVEFKGRKVLTQNFDTYDIPRFSMLPKIETVLVENRDLPPQGGGEPAVTCVGASIANAIFDATGARLFQMAMTPERVQEALDR